MTLDTPAANSSASQASHAAPESIDLPAIGIDLGTTTCAVARLSSSGVECFPLEGDSPLIPSVLFIDDRITAGQSAIELGLDNPDAVVEAFKRDMGEPHFNRKIRAHWVPPEVLSAMMLDEIRERASRLIGEVNEVVITVPAYFDERRRKATLEAGRLAGLRVMDIINEPVAAALAEIHHAGRLDGSHGVPAKIMVYDLGGGTFDVSVLEVAGDEMTTLASDGDVRLGGRDFDERLVDYVAEKFLKQHNIDPRADFGFVQRLWSLVQRAKHELSSKDSTVVKCSFAGMELDVKVDRARFEHLIEPLLERTISTSIDALEQAGLAWSQLDEILLVGGSSRIPFVARKLSEASGMKPRLCHEPDLAVAKGAALFAAMKTSKTLAPFRVINVNAHSLGIAGVNVRTGEPINRILIPRNSRLPASKRQKFVTRTGQQRTVEIKIVEGESENPEYCVPVGKCIVTLSPDLPAQTEVFVTCRYSNNGTVSVSGLVPATHQAAHVEIRRDAFMDLESLPVWRDRLLRGVTAPSVVTADLPLAPKVAMPDPLDRPQVVRRIDYLCQQVGQAATDVKTSAPLEPLQKQVINARREYVAVQHLLGRVRSAMAIEQDRLEKSKLQSSAAALRNYLAEVETYFIYSRIAMGAACIEHHAVPEALLAEADEARALTATVAGWVDE